MFSVRGFFTFLLFLLIIPRMSTAQPTTAPFDHFQNMLDQLGIQSIRAGKPGTDETIYDESKANVYAGTVPRLLTMSDGTPITTAGQWQKRRLEIRDVFEREIYGKVPENVPAIQWELRESVTEDKGGIPVITRTLAGVVDNSAYPQVQVNIEVSFTVPAHSTAPVPMMIHIGGAGRRSTATTQPASQPAHWTEQAISHGWGYAFISPTSIQPDSNQLHLGIIGLTNRGGPRKPEDWGALRAWAWGVSRLIDYFAAHPELKIDTKKIGVTGLSRFGKAALVAQAMDDRIAVGLIGSSGAGGAKLLRHQYGEAVENLVGRFHYWFAGNFAKYAADEPRMTAADLPVDGHQLIALCAPRPCFISYGTPAGGDGRWMDQRGSFMAAILASPAYELLGTRGLGISEDYLTAPMPEVGKLVGGELAWRQHAGGHDITPNWPAFFEWVRRYVAKAQ